jgi:anti-anti-sigma factor
MSPVDLDLGLRVTVARLSADAHVATISGELELRNADVLRDRLWPLAESGATRVIADMTAVTFIDSTALGVLTGAAKQLRARGGEFVVASDDPRLRRLFEVTGLMRVLHLETTLAEAVERLVGRPV